jgi:hypothetical protein
MTMSRRTRTVVMASVFGLALTAGVANAAEEKLTKACNTAHTYLEYTKKLDSKSLRTLFADKVNFVGYDGQTVTDPDKVAIGYEEGFNRIRHSDYPSKFELNHLLPFGKNGCLMEFSYFDQKKGKFVLAAVDHFEVDEQGKITHFLPYFASSELPRISAHIAKIKEEREQKEKGASAPKQ